MDIAINEQLERLEKMPLSEEELKNLSKCRRVLGINILGLSFIGGAGGYAMNRTLASLPTKLFFSVAFGLVGGFIGLGLGVQYAQYALLSGPKSGLTLELYKLQDLLRDRRL